MGPDVTLVVFFVLIGTLSLLGVGLGLYVSNRRAYHALLVHPWWQLPQDRRTTFVRRQVLIFVGVTTLLTVWKLIPFTHIPSPLELARQWGEAALGILLLNLLGLSPAYIRYALVRRRSTDHGNSVAGEPQ